MFEVSTLSPSRGPRQNDLVHEGYYKSHISDEQYICSVSFL